MKEKYKMRVFGGKSAMMDYLDVENHPYLPMVELPESLNPFSKDKVRIFAKLLNENPLQNVKALPAFNMLKEAREKGDLKNVHTLIEDSSGNTAFSLAIIGRLFGINKTKVLISNEVLEGKLRLLQLFGAEITVRPEPICPDPADRSSGIHVAKQMGMQEGYLNPAQYDNFANPRAHEKITGKQIWAQTEGKITVLCAGLGTTGTMVGTATYLRKKSKNLKTIGVVRTANNPIPGVRTANLLRMIAFDWKKYVDQLEEVGTKHSYSKSLEMIRAGLCVGPSSGFSFVGLLQFLEKMKQSNKLDSLKNKDGEVVAVFICCDSPFPYVNEYFDNLNSEYFSKIENENLLLYKNGNSSKGKDPIQGTYALSPSEAFDTLFAEHETAIWSNLKKGKKIKIKAGMKLLDVRVANEFGHFHVPGSENIEFHKLSSESYDVSGLREQKVYIICNRGNMSLHAANRLRNMGVEAYSIEGGITEWSNLNLPRWRPNICVNY